MTQNCMVRIHKQPSIHSFVIQGTNALYLVYLPMFNIANYRRQVIIAGRLSDDVMKKYIQAKENKKNVIFTMHTKSAALSDLKTLDQIIGDGKFTGDIYEGIPNIYGLVVPGPVASIGILMWRSSSPFLQDIAFTITSVHIDKPLDREFLRPYPTEMPFTLYGSPEEWHIDHILENAPNAQLTASGVTLNVAPALDGSKNYIVTFNKQIEWGMQPFTCRQPPKFFKPDTTFAITVRETDSQSVSTGTLTLSQNAGEVFVNYCNLNEEIAADIYVTVPKDSNIPEQQIKPDIDNISKMLVSLFQIQDITWSMNVPSAIRRNLAVAQYYSVTLGPPDAAVVKPRTYHAIVSRFVGGQQAQTGTLQHETWGVNFERFEAT